MTTSNVSFLRGSNTQLRNVTAGPFTAGPLSDVTPLQCTADPTPELHGRSSSRGPSHSFLVVTSNTTIGTFEATRFFSYHKDIRAKSGKPSKEFLWIVEVLTYHSKLYICVNEFIPCVLILYIYFIIYNSIKNYV